MIILKILEEYGLKPFRTSDTDGGVYASACPFCREGNDRFIIWPHGASRYCTGRYWCRRCSKKGDTIDLYVKLKGVSDKEAKRLFYAQKTDVEKIGFISPMRLLTSAPIEWQKKLGTLVDVAHKNLLLEKGVLEKLSKRGILKETIQHFKLGLNRCKTTFKAEDLGYKKEDNQKNILVFAGVMIPTFEPSGKLIRIKVRRLDWKPSDKIGKYLAVSGSMAGLNLIGNRKAPHVIVVESELDAFAVQNVLQDKALVVAVGSNTKNPDAATDYLIKKKDKLLVIYDNDDGGKAMFDKWKGLYKKTQGISSPVGKDIGEAFEQGYDVKSWLEGLLKS